MKKNICLSCRFYYVTFDPANPYGCKAFKFISKRNPSLVVKDQGGHECQLFEKKPEKDKKDSFNNEKYWK